MSKKLVNEVDHVVDECLAGLVAAHPGLSLLQGHRVIVRSDISSLLDQNKVTLLSGGGSGHEPSHGGFVGRGMLTAAVAGSVFASPPPASILAALRAIASPAGTLMIVKNYMGDRLNFGIAAERAKGEGVRVVMVVVGEDTALPSTGKSAGRRGLCGTVLVHKVAGALAERGCSLEEVASAAQRVADSIATMSVSLSPCSVPGHKPSFLLAEDEMELGLGIHGEAGAQRSKLQPADEVVGQMLSHLTSQEPGYQYFTAEPEMEVVLVVNNLGGTSNLELGIVANAAIKYLTDRLKLKVVRVYMGALMTSLEMAGVSLTLLRVQADWKECLDLPTTAPGWPNVSLGVDGTAARVVSPPLSFLQDQQQTKCSTTAETRAGHALKAAVEAVCCAMQASAEVLNELDRGSGDGDCGSTLKSGADAILSASVPWDDARQSLLVLAECVERSMGGTSGAVYTLFLMAGAAVVGQTPGPMEWLKALQAGMEAIMRYGGAAPGDRTMLDALDPAVKALSHGLQESDRQQWMHTLKQAMKAAEEGAAATAGMEARAGRASYVHSSQLKRPDPGAHAVAVWMGAIVTALQSFEP